MARNTREKPDDDWRRRLVTIAFLSIICIGQANSLFAVQQSAETTEMKDAPANQPLAVSLLETFEAPANDESPLATIKGVLKGIAEVDMSGDNLLRHKQGTQEVQPQPARRTRDLLSQEIETSRQVEMLGDRIRKLIEQEKRRQEVEIQRRLNEDDVLNAQTTRVELSNPSETTPDIAEESSAADSEATIPEEAIAENSDSSWAPETTRILSQPADHLALANSLFYAGEIELALDLYRTVNPEKTGHPSDAIWIQYQIATCLRKTSQPGEAEKLFRKVAEQSGSGQVGKNARWWLDTDSRRRSLEQELGELQQYIEFREDSDESHTGSSATNTGSTGQSN